jgi:hypothetical protein
LKLVNEISLDYDARSKKHQNVTLLSVSGTPSLRADIHNLKTNMKVNSISKFKLVPLGKHVPFRL